MTTFIVFKRSATSFETLVSAEKETIETGLSEEEARALCKEFNLNRTEEEKTNGTKLEFTEE